MLWWIPQTALLLDLWTELIVMRFQTPAAQIARISYHQVLCKERRALIQQTSLELRLPKSDSWFGLSLGGICGFVLPSPTQNTAALHHQLLRMPWQAVGWGSLAWTDLCLMQNRMRKNVGRAMLFCCMAFCRHVHNDNSNLNHLQVNIQLFLMVSYFP